jgi:anaerobic selenocysteine-containing dehydrogenase
MDYKTVLTTCAYCGCGCGLYLEVLDGEAVGTIPSKTNPINEGKLCVKGWNIHEFVQHPSRLTKPLIRKNGTLTEANWDEALDYTASRLKEIKEVHGSVLKGASNRPVSGARMVTITSAVNHKSEYRNPKQIQIFKIQMTKTAKSLIFLIMF